MRRLVLALILSLPGPMAASAQPVSQLHAGYDIYARGLDVAELEAGFGLGPRDYQMQMAYHTTGLVGVLYRGHQLSTVQGIWDGNRPEPLRFSGDGVWRGQLRRILIDYDGGQPVVRSLVPPNDAERDPVPPQLQENTVDTLSALTALIHNVQQTGRCEAAVNTFDGRRLAQVSARTAGEEFLEPTSRSIFSGRALRCDFAGRQLAGFLRDADPDELRRPQRGSAWLAQVIPGAPPLPVRISFETRWFGAATMYLAKAGPGLPPLAASNSDRMFAPEIGRPVSQICRLSRIAPDGRHRASCIGRGASRPECRRAL